MVTGASLEMHCAVGKGDATDTDRTNGVCSLIRLLQHVSPLCLRLYRKTQTLELPCPAMISFTAGCGGDSKQLLTGNER